MSGDELTVAILREIRDEIRTTNQRLDVTNQRLDVTNQRLETTNQRLEVVETTVTDFAAQHLVLTRYTKNIVDRHSQSIDDLRERVTKLESAR